MTHVSLFTGIGGLDLAAEWAGFHTVLQVERDPYCLKVLNKHWPHVRRIHDIREVTHSSYEGEVTLLSGGFPCQPFSQAGKRRGAEDNRYLWPEMLRVVGELNPTFVVGENVSGLLSINAGVEFERVCTDLESLGYEVLPLHYPAAGVGARHLRHRIFIVANNARIFSGWEEQWTVGQRIRQRGESENMAHTTSFRGRQETHTRSTYSTSEDVANSNQQGPQGHRRLCECSSEWITWKGGRPLEGIWESEPDVGRVANGVPRRVDRLRALGNAVVPQQAYPIFKAIAHTIQGWEE